MKSRNTFIILATSLLLIGAGCASRSRVQEEPAMQESEDTMMEETVMMEDENSAMELSTTVELDDTWQTYTSKALPFSFRWPMRGLYAPEWRVDLLSAEDVDSDGCYAGDLEKTFVYVGETQLCHTASDTEGMTTATDHYTMKLNDQNVKVTFTKDSSGLGDTFSWNEYHAFIDQIMSTFSLSK